MDIQRKTLAINFKTILIGMPIPIIVIIFFIQYNTTVFEENIVSEEEQNFFNFDINFKNYDMVELPIDSIFKISGVKDDFRVSGNTHIYSKLSFELDEENFSQYDKLMNTDEKTIVIFSIFTASAYNSPGFYDYYNGNCDETCLTVPIKPILRTEMGGNGAQILKLLNYKFLSDMAIDKNPDILNSFDKVILLHNEYVTKNEFNAITSHPNVIYLYPNALHGEIEVDYDSNTITLVRGHGYADKYNGFDWEHDNSSYEYDTDCDDWEFYEIDNGKMLNCYPEEQLYQDILLLKTLKDF